MKSGLITRYNMRQLDFDDGFTSASSPTISGHDDGTLWVTATDYVIGNVVTDAVGDKIYRCTSDHTSGASIAGDIANWTEVSGAGSVVSDTAYDESTWNGVTGVAPSKNAVRDKIETMIDDTAYDESTWDGDTNAPTKNAVRDKIETMVDDTVYGAGWNGDVDTAPSKNAVYDKIETIGGSVSDAAYGAGWNGDTTTAASKNAIYDKIEAMIDDTAYGVGWDTDTNAPTKNAVYDKVETIVDDTVYGVGWNGVTDVAPSKNAVYDKIETLGGGGTGDLTEWSSGSWSSGNTVIDMVNGGIYQCIAAHTSSTDTDLSADWDTGAWTYVSEREYQPLYTAYTPIPTGAWSSVGQVNSADAVDYQTWACIWSSSDGTKVYTVGGDNQAWSNNTVLECDLTVDPTTFSSIGSINQGRLQGCLFVDEPNGLVYYVGGTTNGSANVGTVEVADRDNPTVWSCLGVMANSYVNRDCAHVIHEGMCYQFGGDGGTTRIIAAPITDMLQWSSVGSILAARSQGFQRIKTDASDKGYMFGSFSDDRIMEADMSDLTTWSSIGLMGTTNARYFRSMLISDDTLIARFGTPTQNLAVYKCDPTVSLTSWSSIGSTPAGHMACPLYVHEGWMYQMGGTSAEIAKHSTRTTHSNQTEAIDPRSLDELNKVNSAVGGL